MPPPTEADMVNYCVSCACELSGLFFHCAECSELSRPLGFCAQCFAFGIELRTHSNRHAYKIINADHSLFRVGPPNPMRSKRVWPIGEEVRLVEAVERFSLGWAVINHNAGMEKSFPSDPRAHYEQFYLSGPMANVTLHTLPPPVPVIDRCLPVSWPKNKPKKKEDGPVSWDDKPGTDGGQEPSTSAAPIEEAASPRASRSLSDDTEDSQDGQDRSIGLLNAAGTKGHSLLDLGWMPRRADFEHEWSNAADESLKPLLPLPEDDSFDRGVLAALCQSYAMVVSERERRKRTISEHSLIAQFYSRELKLQTKRSRTTEQNAANDTIELPPEKHGTHKEKESTHKDSPTTAAVKLKSTKKSPSGSPSRNLKSVKNSPAVPPVTSSDSQEPSTSAQSTCATTTLPPRLTRSKAARREALETQRRTKHVCQFINREEYSDLLNDLSEFRLLKSRILQLQRWKSKGIKTNDDGREFDRAKLQLIRSGVRSKLDTDSSTGSTKHDAASNLSSAEAKADSNTGHGNTGGGGGDSYGHDAGSGSTSGGAKPGSFGRKGDEEIGEESGGPILYSVGDGEEVVEMIDINNNNEEYEPTQTMDKYDGDGGDNEGDGRRVDNVENSGMALNTTGSGPGRDGVRDGRAVLMVPLSVDDEREKLNSLSSQERSLLDELNLPPSQYLLLKATVLAHAALMRKGIPIRLKPSTDAQISEYNHKYEIIREFLQDTGMS